MKKILIVLCLFFINIHAQTDSIPSFNFPEDINKFMNYAVTTNNISYFEVVNQIEGYYSTPSPSTSATSGNTASTSTNTNPEDDGNLSRYSRWKNYWKSRVDAKGSFHKGNEEAINYIINPSSLTCTDARTSNLNWQCVGPSNSNGSKPKHNGQVKQNQGRVDCIAIDPLNNNNILIGTRTGGIFRTTDGGQNWNNTTDEEKMSHFGTMDMAFHPTNSNYVVATTGNNSSSYGIGAIHSFDGGETWSLIPGQDGIVGVGEREYYFTEVRIDPRSDLTGHMRIYFMTPSKVLMFDNTLPSVWKVLHKRTWVDDNKSDYTDFEFKNGDENWFYFVIRTKLFSGNVPWNNPNVLSINLIPNSDILANVVSGYDNIGQMRLRVANDNSMYLALKVSNSAGNTKTYFNTTFGTNIFNWTATETTEDIRLESFEVNKVNPNFMYAKWEGYDLARSTDGGQNWEPISNGYEYTRTNVNSASSPNMHVDIRYIKIHNATLTGQDEVYVGTDGGVQKSTNGLNFTGINGEGLTIAQYYRGMAVNQRTKDEVLLGAQDGNINFYKNNSWQETDPDGDNFACLVNPSNPIVYHHISNHSYERTDENFVSNSSFGNSDFDYYPVDQVTNTEKLLFEGFQLEMSPANENRLMIGQYDVYFSDDNGQTYFNLIPTSITDPQGILAKSNISSLKISKSNPNISYYARENGFWDYHDDGIIDYFGGGIYKLEETSPGTFVQTNITNNLLLPDYTLYNANTVNDFDQYPLMHASISDIAIDPKNENRIWITFDKFDENAKVWYTLDGGLTWNDNDPSNSIPNFPVNAIQYHEGSNDRLYIATDVGVFYKDNSMLNWCRYADIPSVSVTDVDINYCSQTLYASIWCRGLWKAPLLKISNINNMNTISGSNVLWDTDMSLNSSFRITPGTKLKLENMTLNMPKGARIIVDQGARLEINNATITNVCGELWDGIDVEGVSSEPNPNIADVIADNYPGNFPSYLNQQGVLLIDNNSVIEHATTAVRLSERDATGDHVSSGRGGVVIAKNSSFKNNRRSVEFMRYVSDFSSSVFEDCQFFVDDDYRYEKTHTEDVGLGYQFTMWDIHGVDILGCKFKDERTGIDISEWDDAKSIGGIYSIDADYTLRSYKIGNSNSWKRSRFDNLYRAVKSIETCETMGSIRLDENDINNCKYGIYLKATNTSMITRNNIFGLNENKSILGITMEGMSGYNFTENKIKKMQIGAWGKSIGNQAGANLYKNEFSYNHTESALLMESNPNLQVECNTFSNNKGFDIRNTGSFANQGNNNKTTGNEFSVDTDHPTLGISLTTGVMVKSQLDPNYSYFHKTSIAETPEFVSSGIILEPLPSSGAHNACANRTLLFYDEETETTINAHETFYESLLGDVLPDVQCQQFPYLCLMGNHELVEFALDELLILHGTDPDIKDPNGTGNGGGVPVQDAVNSLKEHQTSPLRKAQLGAYYTLLGEYTLADNTLTNLKSNETNQEWRDLADLYIINNNLQSQNKTWLEASATDLNFIRSLASGEDFDMASVKARNILELLMGVSYTEGRPEEFRVDPNNASNNEVSPEFSLYPNPINGILNIGYNLPITTPFIVQIFDLINHNQVYEGIMSSAPFVLDVSNWNSGYYSVVITDNSGEILFKSSTKIKN